MSFDYTVDTENQLITITGLGHASMEERYACVQRMLNNRSIGSEHNILINVCQVINAPLPGDIDSIVSLIERLQSKFKGRVAILNTAAGHVTFTNLITLSAHCGPDIVRAFLSENEAREWLSVGPSH